MNKLDLNKIEEKLDNALENETTESLTNWLKEKRNKNNNMAQTSVEWLFEELTKHFFDLKKSKELLQEAKAIHKEETLRFVRTMPRKTGVTQEGQSYVQYDDEAHYNNTYNKM